MKPSEFEHMVIPKKCFSYLEFLRNTHVLLTACHLEDKSFKRTFP